MRKRWQWVKEWNKRRVLRGLLSSPMVEAVSRSQGGPSTSPPIKGSPSPSPSSSSLWPSTLSLSSPLSSFFVIVIMIFCIINIKYILSIFFEGVFFQNVFFKVYLANAFSKLCELICLHHLRNHDWLLTWPALLDEAKIRAKSRCR